MKRIIPITVFLCLLAICIWHLLRPTRIIVGHKVACGLGEPLPVFPDELPQVWRETWCRTFGGMKDNG